MSLKQSLSRSLSAGSSSPPSRGVSVKGTRSFSEKGGDLNKSLDESDVSSSRSPAKNLNASYDSESAQSEGSPLRRGMSSRSESQSPERGNSSLSRSPSRRSRGLNRSLSARSTGSRKAHSSSKSRSPNRRGRSRSPKKFGQKDFKGRRTNSGSQRRRRKALAKMRGLKDDLTELTKQEIMERLRVFARFTQDKKSGSAELFIESKRLLDENLDVLNEIMRRVTEIQKITINNCAFSDDMLESISKGLRSLRHLKELNLCRNALTVNSVKRIIKLFSNLSRRLEALNVHGNPQLAYKEGRMLYKAFRPGILYLNRIPVKQLKAAEVEATSLELTGLNMCLLEIGMVSAILENMKACASLNLAENNIDAVALRYVVDLVKKNVLLIRLNVSENPLLDNNSSDEVEEDLSGIQYLLQFLQQNTRVNHAQWDGVNVPDYYQQLLEQALMTNRAFHARYNGFYFSNFADKLVRRMAPPEPTEPTSNMLDSLKTIDLDFVRANRLPQMHVSVEPGTSTVFTSGMVPMEDLIIVEKKPNPKGPVIKF